MIISASRRTDIPALYWPWLCARLREGHALARNPMNARQVRAVDLSPKGADGFVFWTKNPGPALDQLGALRGRAFYFQFTLTPYGPDVEPNLPTKEALIDTFRRLADRIGPARISWRCDPVLISPDHPVDWHVEQFDALARQLSGYVSDCTFSFLDEYRKIARTLRERQIRTPDAAERLALAQAFARSARDARIALATCCEGDEYKPYIARGICVDARRLGAIAGRELDARPDRNQRPGCNCAQSVDIGAYDTCLHGCLYCYASASAAAVARSAALHNPRSPLLVGQPESDTEGRTHTS